MKSPTLRTGVIGLVIVVVLAGLYLAAPWSASASLGTRGVPVRCYTPGSTLGTGQAAFLTCVSADGTPFAGGQRVPSGYYLLVTDVLMTPSSGAAADARSYVTVFSAYGDMGRQSAFSLQSTTADTYSYTFSAPYLVLPPDYRLEVVSAASSQAALNVRITGLLTNNVTYIPMVGQEW